MRVEVATLDTSHLPRGWLNAVGRILHVLHLGHVPLFEGLLERCSTIEHAAHVMSLDTSQPLISSLKSEAPFLSLKGLRMSVTPLVSHSPIGPYCAIAAARSLLQGFTALGSVLLVNLVVGATAPLPQR